MNKQTAFFIAELRLLVGYLGEQRQFNWWSSNFLGPSSAAFLAPIFSRSMAQAQYQGVNEAALRVHDEHIGVGQTYHLFRLPESYEMLAAQTLSDTQFSEQIKNELTNQEQAITRLQELASGEIADDEGPVNLGDFNEQMFETLLKKTAACYHDAFLKGIKCYPYFRDSK